MSSVPAACVAGGVGGRAGSLGLAGSMGERVQGGGHALVVVHPTQDTHTHRWGFVMRLCLVKVAVIPSNAA